VRCSTSEIATWQRSPEPMTLLSATNFGETAIGYRLGKFGHNASRSYGVTLNSAKSAEVTFEPDDKIVVLAND
jgi:hypothetical protein